MGERLPGDLTIADVVNVLGGSHTTEDGPNARWVDSPYRDGSPGGYFEDDDQCTEDCAVCRVGSQLPGFESPWPRHEADPSLAVSGDHDTPAEGQTGEPGHG